MNRIKRKTCCPSAQKSWYRMPAMRTGASLMVLGKGTLILIERRDNCVAMVALSPDCLELFVKILGKGGKLIFF